ncbi:MAG: energy-coupling factor ABC transporter ATP-binding protein [Acidimicrobiia bacterium]|nr:energy-coupling factor ABC transporter ATP-binding protein [Acidimicrobiia bacterium]
MTIQCVDIYYSYPNGVQALKGVSLDLSSGCVAIVGENGSGKTTLAKTLNGLYRPSQGRVLVDERDAAGLRVAALARQVGIAFQNPDDQLFHSSVRDEVCFGPRESRIL